MASSSTVPAGQLVKKLGKYLYRQLDGAFRQKISDNMYDVYTVVLYTTPNDIIKQYDLPDSYKDVNEMEIDINITTYANKIRVNVIEMSPQRKTLGHDIYPLEKLQNLEEARHIIYNKVKQRICKEYEGWDFIF